MRSTQDPPRLTWLNLKQTRLSPSTNKTKPGHSPEHKAAIEYDIERKSNATDNNTGRIPQSSEANLG